MSDRRVLKYANMGQNQTSLEPPFPEDDTSCANFYGLFISDKAGDSHEESKVSEVFGIYEPLSHIVTDRSNYCDDG